MRIAVSRDLAQGRLQHSVAIEPVAGHAGTVAAGKPCEIDPAGVHGGRAQPAGNGGKRTDAEIAADAANSQCRACCRSRTGGGRKPHCDAIVRVRGARRSGVGAVVDGVATADDGYGDGAAFSGNDEWNGGNKRIRRCTAARTKTECIE